MGQSCRFRSSLSCAGCAELPELACVCAARSTASTPVILYPMVANQHNTCVWCVCVCVCVCVCMCPRLINRLLPLSPTALGQLASHSWPRAVGLGQLAAMADSSMQVLHVPEQVLHVPETSAPQVGSNASKWTHQASGHTKQGAHKPLPWLRSRYPTPRSGACVRASERACMCTRMCVCVCVRISYVRARTDASRTHARASTHASTHAHTHSYTHICTAWRWLSDFAVVNSAKRPTLQAKETHTANKRAHCKQKRPTLPGKETYTTTKQTKQTNSTRKRDLVKRDLV